MGSGIELGNKNWLTEEGGLPRELSWLKNPPAMQNTQFNPWVGSSHGERTGYPLQYSWASLVTQLVKNLPAIKETWV